MKVIIKLAVLAAFFFVAILLGEIIFEKTYPFPSQIKYGVTFSSKYSTYLNLNWKDTYIKVLDDLKVSNLRLPTYWDIIEADKGHFDFSQTDFMLDEAQKRQAKTILVLGVRQPRWPECHIPNWAKDLSIDQRQKKTLQFISEVVKRYQQDPAISAWQVENEPLLTFFGEGCDSTDRDFLKSEVELVRSLDKRPVILTDSGELRVWVTPMRLSDIFGTTVYRTVYNRFLGYIDYPLLPYFYNLKSSLVRFTFAPQNQKTVIIELQAEPWLPNSVLDTKPEQQTKVFSEKKFKDNIDYAKKTGFDEAYLWGVEWWYFMAQNGYPQYLEYAKTLFK